MRRTPSTLRAAVAALLTVATFAAAHTSMASPKIGEPAPEFSAVDSAGRQRSLSEFRGKTVVLEWTNDGCPFVKNHYDTGNMQALQAAAAKAGVVWLSVISSAPGRQGHVNGLEADELTMKRKASPAAVLLDPAGAVGRLYDARTTPHMYVVRPDGTLAYRGAIDDRPTVKPEDPKLAFNYVRNALDRVAAGVPVEPSTTRPYGCSVKYAD